MAGGIKGITVEIGGDTTKLGKALSDVNGRTKSLQTELKGVNTLLKMDPGNVTLLAQKQEILTQAIGETKSKLELLKDTQAQVERQFESGEIGADQYRDFQREIILTEQKLKDLTDELENVDSSTSDIEKVEGAVDDLGDAAENSSGGFSIMKGALADLTANAISGAISKVGDFVGSLMELSEATEEYRIMQGKLEGSANSFGYSVDFVDGKYKEFYKYLGDDMAATNAITNLLGVGTSTESVAKLAEGATAVWTAYGDSINVESLTESINETVTCGKVTGSLADTINWCKESNEGLKNALSGNKEAQSAYNKAIKEGLPVEDAFNEALAKVTDEQERADIVAKFLNTTYGDSKKAYDEVSDSVLNANDAELKLKETQAQLGETLSPVNTAFTNMKAQALEAIAPLVERIATGFMNMLTWLKEHPTVMTIVTAVVVALGAAFTVLAGALLIQGIISGVTKAFAFLNTTLLANPIVLIIAAIAALVAAFVVLWNKCEGFRNFWIKLWEIVKNAASVAWTAIKNFFSAAWDWIRNVWNAAPAFFSSIWSSIRSAFSAVGSWFSNIFQTAWSGIKNAFSAVGSFFASVWSGIKNAFGSVKSWFSNVFRSAWNAIKNVFSGWGSFFSGLWGKIKSTFSSLGTSIANAIGGAIKSGINGVISMIENTINGAINLINGAIGLINKIPGVAIGRIGRLSLPRLAKGGIVDSPTIAEIGENGREAIIPLEKNTEWLDKLAQRLNSRVDTVSPSDNTALLSKLDRIYDRLNRLQIVLDSGALVGETVDKFDAALAEIQGLKARRA